MQAFNIKCNVTSEINHMQEGIRLGLTEDREKHSESLGRTAQWSGKAALATLPAYLTVQIMRFYYKVTLQQRAKIMRKVMIFLWLERLPSAALSAPSALQTCHAPESTTHDAE
jgi:hypothetical protein